MTPPSLSIPSSTSCVSIAIIETTSRIIADTGIVVRPKIAGHDEFNDPSFAFLISHPATGRKMLFDLGIRKDHKNLTPTTQKLVSRMTIRATQDVADILGNDAAEINDIIWSHHHFDHIGNPARFPSTTNLIVGEGFKKEFLPGYPEREDAWIRQSDYEGRDMRELSFSGPGTLKIGQYDAIDFLEDGSFYLLNCPGHTVGHIMGLARTTPTTFVLLAADCCHHGGEIRPSESKPLPDEISPNPLLNHPRYPRTRPCPGSLFTDVHPHKSRTKSFYELKTPPDPDALEEAKHSQRKLEEFDAHDDILLLSAHDAHAADVVDLYPKYLNDWKEKGWKTQLHWAFLNDFAVT